ncbi:MAG: zf-HC2 domain-containing protein [Galbitalea sp.]
MVPQRSEQAGRVDHPRGNRVAEACRWTISRLGENARHALTPREQERVNEHLLNCTKCTIVSEEVDEVGSHLAMVLLPLLLGAGVGGAILATSGHAAATVAASVVPVMPASVAAHAVLAPAVFAPAIGAGLAMGSATGVSAFVGSLAIAAAVGGAVVLGMGVAPSHDVAAGPSTSQHASAGALASALAVPTPAPGAVPGLGGGPLGGGASGGNLGNAVGGAVGTVGGVVSEVGTTVNGVVGNTVSGLGGVVDPGAPPAGQAAPGGAPVTTSIQLGGKGTPFATIAAQAGGVVYGTAKVNANGTWSLLVTALPAGTSTLQLRQSLLSLLGLDLVNVPLTLNTGPLGVVVQLLN